MKARAELAAAALWVSALAAACTPLRAEFGGFDRLGPEEVAVVGQVRLDPPLGPGEQDPEMPMSAYPTKDMFYMDVADHPRELDKKISMSLGSNSIKAALGQSFRVVVAKTDRFFNGGYIIMRQRPPAEVSAFPIGAAAPIDPADRAVYIGTVVYHRDRFNECVRIEVVDEYAREVAEFTRLYGATPKLEKRLLAPVSYPQRAAEKAGAAPTKCHF